MTLSADFLLFDFISWRSYSKVFVIQIHFEIEERFFYIIPWTLSFFSGSNFKS